MIYTNEHKTFVAGLECRFQMAGGALAVAEHRVSSTDPWVPIFDPLVLKFLALQAEDEDRQALRRRDEADLRRELEQNTERIDALRRRNAWIAVELRLREEDGP